MHYRSSKRRIEMGWFDAVDRLANAGARSQMPAETLTRARDQSQTTNDRQQLAIVANPGFGASRAAQRAAEKQLIDAVGRTEAKRLKKEAVHKVRNTFAR
jgi:hypothetical protein